MASALEQFVNSVRQLSAQGDAGGGGFLKEGEWPALLLLGAEWWGEGDTPMGLTPQPSAEGAAHSSPARALQEQQDPAASSSRWGRALPWGGGRGPSPDPTHPELCPPPRFSR